MESFGATGWSGTDWIEDLVLRLHGPEVYDQWTAGAVPFTDDLIRAAFDHFGEITLHPGRVTGGPRSILTVPALEEIAPMFEDPPGCLPTRQASFQEGNLPADVTVGPQGEVDVLALPPVNDEKPPLLTSGEIAAAFSPSDEALKLIPYLADPRSGEPWAEIGGYISPHLGFDQTAYGTEFERRLGELVAEAEVVRFDGSDLMPPAVGTGTFWEGMINYVAGLDLDSVLENIQAGYDSGSS